MQDKYHEQQIIKAPVGPPKMEGRHGICQNCGKRGYLRRVSLVIPDSEGETKDYFVCIIRYGRNGRPKGCNSDQIKAWDLQATIRRQQRE